MNIAVIDTNVFVAGLRSGGGASREIIRLALTGKIQPIFGNALWLEYEDLLGAIYGLMPPLMVNAVRFCLHL